MFHWSSASDLGWGCSDNITSPVHCVTNVDFIVKYFRSKVLSGDSEDGSSEGRSSCWGNGVNEDSVHEFIVISISGSSKSNIGSKHFEFELPCLSSWNSKSELVVGHLEDSKLVDIHSIFCEPSFDVIDGGTETLSSDHNGTLQHWGVRIRGDRGNFDERSCSVCISSRFCLTIKCEHNS